MGREIFSLSSHILSRTDHLIVGTGVAIIYTYEPIATANATRTLAELFRRPFYSWLRREQQRLPMRGAVLATINLSPLCETIWRNESFPILSTDAAA